MPAKYFLGILTLVLLVACGKKDSDEVIFDVSFKSARLAAVEVTGKNAYRAKVLPAFEPVNKSPWYAFAVTAKGNTTINLTLDYGAYQHRYVPKLSTDKIHWQPMDSSKIEIDTLDHTATLQLEVSPKKLYVSAQEIETSDDTYAWMKTFDQTQIVVAGKTVLGKDIYAIVHEPENANNAIVLVARQHPPEIPGGTIGFKSFYETLFSEAETAKAFRKFFNIYTFPLLNPDGADMGNWRHNAKGVDLNRDWIDFTQPETQTVKQFVEDKVQQGKKIRFALDFHTSYSGPYILVLDSVNEVKTIGVIPEWIKKIDSTSSFTVEARRRSQELPYCYNYFINAFNTEAVTYEDGDEINRDTIRKKAEVYAEQLMKTLLEKQNNGAFSE
ncbi:M14 family metallopeptidase [Flagellimonas myxillae]|uniref:M14 family metallopeptidase n=1 Tax=Flagellimonas myxillae TaxID=2942214 RepID=UPI00201F61C3|nr:M14 family metallopeptidase [Muricauda myxillae]MCL6266301.1 M14 family metallopeptidase [Muricauda myxillae]